MDSNSPDKKESRLNSGAIKSAFFAIFISIIASIIYDSTLKPSASYFYKALQNIIDIFFKSARDYSYFEAAHDPTAIPALVILIIIAAFMTQALLASMIKALFFRSKVDEKIVDVVVKNKRKILILLRVVILINGLFVLSLGLTAITVLNNSVLVWRKFHNNVEAISPYIESKDLLKLRSMFFTMKNRSDFDVIEKIIYGIADKNGVNVSKFSTW